MMSLYDIRQLNKPLYSQSNNIKNISSMKMTNDKIVTSGIDGQIKVYKQDNSEILKLEHQFKACDGILGMNIDPIGLNYAYISLGGELNIWQKPYYNKKDTMDNIYKGQGLIHIKEEESKLDAVLTSNGKKYTEKDLTTMFARGFMHKDTGSYKYYNRGLYAKTPKNEDEHIIIRTEKTSNLSLHDKHLRKFKFKEALENVLKSGNSLNILGVLEQLMITDDFETALSEYCLETKNVITILKFINKKIISDDCLTTIQYLLERVIYIAKELIVNDRECRDWLKQIKNRNSEFREKEEKAKRIKYILHKKN